MMLRAFSVAGICLLAVFGSWVGAAYEGEKEDRALLVFAASSLTDAFSELAERFEEENPGVEVSLATAGSQMLRLQIEGGARADIFASANAHHMDALRASGFISQSTVFAQNELALVVPEQNPAGIRSFRDLPQAEHVVVGTPEAPIGAYTRAMFAGAAQRFGPEFRDAVEGSIASQEPNVRMVLAKVALGETDAAVVYRSDLVASRRVKPVEVPPEINPRVAYHMGQTSTADAPGLASRWMAFAGSREGRTVLRRHGFLASGK